MAELKDKDLQQVDGGLSHDNFIIDPDVCLYPDIEIDTEIIYNWEILPTP